MASQSHSTCVAQRSLVRSSSNCRCGRWRLRKQCSCKVCACSPARVRKAGDGRLSVALRHARQPKDPALRPAQRAPLRPGEKGFSVGVYPLGCSPAAFHLMPGSHRHRRWPSTRRGSRGETTGGAIVWGAGLEETLDCGVDGPAS
jgi:hypothetical protein